MHSGGVLSLLKTGVRILPLQRLHDETVTDGSRRHLDPLGRSVHDRSNGRQTKRGRSGALNRVTAVSRVDSPTRSRK